MAINLYEDWISLLDSAGLSDRYIFTLVTVTIVASVFWGTSIFFFAIDRFKLFPECKIQPNVEPDPILVNRCFWHCIVSQFVVNPVFIYFAFPLFTHFGLTLRGPFPSTVTILRDFVAAIAIHDTAFYWVHRGLHHKAIYKYIHKKHHLFKVPIGISSIYTHPIEDLFAGLLPTLGGCLLMGSHALVLWLWLFIRVMETVDAHSGYSFIMSPFHLLPFQGGADRHDYHHSHNVGCYGSFTIFWDHVMGTDEAFKAFQKAKNEANNEAKKK